MTEEPDLRPRIYWAVAIMAVVAFGVVGWTVVRSDDDSVGGGGDDWNEIVLVDRATGAITVVDDSGGACRGALCRLTVPCAVAAPSTLSPGSSLPPGNSQ